jgi:hypothetical protein
MTQEVIECLAGVNVPNRFVFRQVDYRDILTFLNDGAIRSKNFNPTQHCHQTSYQNLVNRRNTAIFQIPGGGVVNDYVAFYFSPVTSFTFTIHKGNVPVVSPTGADLGASQLADRAFVVCKVETLAGSGLDCCYSDSALNSNALLPTIINDLSAIENHVHWKMFDEHPLTAAIPEIGYAGVCKWFHSRMTPQHLQRKERRMAEFLVRDSLSLEFVECIVTPNAQRTSFLQQQMDSSRWSIPIYDKAGCFAQ